MATNDPNFTLLKVSPVARYALTAVSHLARQPRGSLCGVGGIAGGTRLPGSFLSKILRKLARKGIVRSQRGRAGGHELARPAREISLAEILRAVERPRPGLRRCLLELRLCGHGKPCLVHSMAVQAESRFWKALERTSVASYARESGSRGA